MQAQPKLSSGPVKLLQLRQQIAHELLEILDMKSGKKDLVIDKELIACLELALRMPQLKEHGVDQIVSLDSPNVDKLMNTKRYFLIKNSVESCQRIIQQIRAHKQQSNHSLEVVVIAIPMLPQSIPTLFEKEGLLADVTLREWNTFLYPMDDDVVSQEKPDYLKKVLVEQDIGLLYESARALHLLTNIYGPFGSIKAKGYLSVRVLNQFRILYQQGQRNQEVERSQFDLALGGIGQKHVAEVNKLSGRRKDQDGGIDMLIVLDRSLDLVTPLLTQTTFEGLIDEVMGIKSQQLRLSISKQGNTVKDIEATSITQSEASPSQAQQQTTQQKVYLGSHDQFYSQIRDEYIGEVAKSLQVESRRLQSEYQLNTRSTASLGEMQQFVKQIPVVQSLQRNMQIFDSIIKWWTQQDMPQIVFLELDILQQIGQGREAEAEKFIMNLMWQSYPIQNTLRLLCLISLANGGISKSSYERLYKEIMQVYGYQHLLTLQSLLKAGIIQIQGQPAQNRNIPNFKQIRNSYGLFVQPNQNSIASKTDNPILSKSTSSLSNLLLHSKEYHDYLYDLYQGYVPLNIRLVIDGISNPWKNVLHQQSQNQQFNNVALGTLACQQDSISYSCEYHVGQGNQSQNAYQEGSEQDVYKGIKSLNVLLFVIGGISSTEIAAFRKMQQLSNGKLQFLFASSGLLNGSKLLDSFMEKNSQSTLQNTQIL